MAGIFFTGCSKNSNDSTPSLQITFKDESGNLVSGASVKLYRALDRINQIGTTQISGANGIVTFTNLPTDTYTSLAEKGCQTNFANQLLLAYPVTENVLHTVTDFLYNAGHLKLINTTSVNYSITAPFFPIGSTLSSNTTLVTNVRVGSYAIHGEPVTTPGIGRDTVINITCGDTAIISYP